MPGTAPALDGPTLAAVLAELRELKLEVHRLGTAIHRTTAESPESLTTAQVMKRLKMGETKLRGLLARRMFTDARGGLTRGSPWLLFADEVEEYRLRGEAGVKLLRKRTGRA